MVSLKQTGFSGGIISPQLLGRSDQAKYAVGLRQCQNAWVTRYGTIENRPGTQYCGAAKFSTLATRLLPFISALGTAFILEVGIGYIRPWKNGARISVVGAPAWSNATAYTAGDTVTASNSVVYWAIADNTNHDPTAPGVYWHALIDGFLELSASQITAPSVPVLQYVQQNDLMTIAAQAFQPIQIAHYSDTKWALATFITSEGIDAPTGVAVVAGVPPSSAPGIPTAIGAVGGAFVGGGAGADTYIVTAYSAATESAAPSPVTAGAHIQASGIAPIVISWTAPLGGASGYAVFKQAAASGPFGLIALVPSGTLSYSDDATIAVGSPIAMSPAGPAGSQAFSYGVTAVDSASGQESLVSATAFCTGGTPSSDHPNVITWVAVAGAAKYNVYRYVNGIAGFIGSNSATTFNDINITPDTSTQPPVEQSLFATASDYPAVVGYYQQRLCFACTINAPQTVWMSRIGSYQNFTVSTPVSDSAAVTFTISGRQVQPIRAIVDLGKLVIHTSNAEYVCSGNAFGTITPTAISLVQQGAAGSELVAPAVIGNTDLFVQQAATRVCDLRYEVQSFAYTGKDLTKYTPDLFRGRSIVDMAWQKLPHSIVWCVLDNGSLAALTYVREDELWAWHAHASTNGSVKAVAVVPEGAQHALYLLVQRAVNGNTSLYIERLAARDLIDTVFQSDAVFADASLTFDGRNAGSTTMTATTGAGWTPTDVITLTASADEFTTGDVGNYINLWQIDPATGLVSDLVTFSIITYAGARVVTATPQRAVPAWAQSVALTQWGRAVKSFSGMTHLAGQAIAVLADGAVVANPLNSGYPTVTVGLSGTFTLTHPAMVVTAGLPIQMDVETLPLENAQGETIMNKRVRVVECTPNFYRSRGGSFGQDSAHVFPWKQPKTSAQGYPQDLATGPERIPLQGGWQKTGQVHIRNTDPTPFSISALVASGEVGS